ncbi:hypothetical protein DRP98_01430 [candidate division KSB1 bacterium]|nr:MAG: hypothetical protein DRP98_01430 [candidate division KSB1 bacterium]
MNRSKVAIGVDLGGTNLKLAIVSNSGEILHETVRPTGAENGPDYVLTQVEEGIAELLSLTKEHNLVGIGIGSAGPVDFKNGIVHHPPNFPDWEVEPVRDRIVKRFELPTFVDNDANVAALAEGTVGAGIGYYYFLCITLGTGVGCGIVLDGEVYRGKLGAAGEFGHTTIKYDGLLCNCGNYGCVERYVAAKGMVERAVQKLSEFPDSKLKGLHGDNPHKKITPKLISQLAIAGDKLCLQVLQETGELLGIALASVVNLLNVELIILAGGISNAGDLLFKPTMDSIRKHALPMPASIVKLVKAQLGEKAGVIGATQMVFRNV